MQGHCLSGALWNLLHAMSAQQILDTASLSGNRIVEAIKGQKGAPDFATALAQYAVRVSCPGSYTCSSVGGVPSLPSTHDEVADSVYALCFLSGIEDTEIHDWVKEGSKDGSYRAPRIFLSAAAFAVLSSSVNTDVYKQTDVLASYYVCHEYIRQVFISVEKKVSRKEKLLVLQNRLFFPVRVYVAQTLCESWRFRCKAVAEPLSREDYERWIEGTGIPIAHKLSSILASFLRRDDYGAYMPQADVSWESSATVVDPFIANAMFSSRSWTRSSAS
jgi:hypothetical protein